MEQEGTIKTIVPTECPHCRGEFFVEFAVVPTQMKSVFTKEQMLSAKTELLTKVKEMELEDDALREIVEWVSSEATLFGPDEVPAIIKSISPKLKDK